MASERCKRNVLEEVEVYQSQGGRMHSSFRHPIFPRCVNGGDVERWWWFMVVVSVVIANTQHSFALDSIVQGKRTHASNVTSLPLLHTCYAVFALPGVVMLFAILNLNVSPLCSQRGFAMHPPHHFFCSISKGEYSAKFASRVCHTTTTAATTTNPFSFVLY
jgi:hypothetical protein